MSEPPERPNLDDILDEQPRGGLDVPPLPTDDGFDDGVEPDPTEGIERSRIIGHGLRSTADWSLRLIIIGVAAAAVIWLAGKVWVGILPVILALIVASVLQPLVNWFKVRGAPAGVASLGVLLGAVAVVGGVFTAIAPSMISQSEDLAKNAADGLRKLQDWLRGPPVNLNNSQVDGLVDRATEWLNDRAASIAEGVFSGVSAVTSTLLTVLLVFVLSFYFLKDGPRFLPWVRRFAGRNAGRHLTEVFTRIWRSLSGFVRAQAIVSFVDAVLIGIGLLVFQVPLAFALIILTFFGGFIPIVGAVTVGILSVLVALVAHGFTVAIILLVWILVVQQIEGNVLAPHLQGRSLRLHPVVILLAVAGGGALFGIVGAFLAVPVASSVIVVLRYLSELADLRAGDLDVDDARNLTPEGELAAASVHGVLTARPIAISTFRPPPEPTEPATGDDA